MPPRRWNVLFAWMTRGAAVAICASFAWGLWISQPDARRLSWALGVPVEAAPGEQNQFLLRAAQGSVNFSRIGTVHLDRGYAVGVTLLNGTQIGFRFEPTNDVTAVTVAAARATSLVLGVAVLYVLLHFVAFATVLRHISAFRHERNIFLYHVIPATVAAVVAAALVVRDSSALAGAVGLVTIQGIYSLSFLELWSLAEGGYSLAILREISGGGEIAASREPMPSLGTRKVQLRISSLSRLGLVSVADERLELTSMGRLVANLEYGLRALANSQIDR